MVKRSWPLETGSVIQASPVASSGRESTTRWHCRN